MSIAGDLAKDNLEFFEKVAHIYEGKGYNVSCSLCSELNGDCGCNFLVWDQADRRKDAQFLATYQAIRTPDSDDEKVQSARQRLLHEAEDFPSLIDFRRGNIIRHVESLREMAQDADLPDDFLNPVLEWVEQLKTTMLPAPSAQHPAPSAQPPERRGGRSGILKLET